MSDCESVRIKYGCDKNLDHLLLRVGVGISRWLPDNGRVFVFWPVLWKPTLVCRRLLSLRRPMGKPVLLEALLLQALRTSVLLLALSILLQPLPRSILQVLWRPSEIPLRSSLGRLTAWASTLSLTWGQRQPKRPESVHEVKLCPNVFLRFTRVHALRMSNQVRRDQWRI
jgi:hypothetical protein